MADSYVCSKARIKCSFGDKISTLTVFPDRTIWLTGQPQGNISDHISIKNIAPFGKCHTVTFPPTGSATAANHGKLTPMPCMPNTPFPWMGGKNDVILKGHPALLKSSKCRCAYGGVISFVSDGQVEGTYREIHKESIATFRASDSNSKNSSLDEVSVKRNEKHRREELKALKEQAIEENKVIEIATYRKEEILKTGTDDTSIKIGAKDITGISENSTVASLVFPIGPGGGYSGSGGGYTGHQGSGQNPSGNSPHSQISPVRRTQSKEAENPESKESANTDTLEITETTSESVESQIIQLREISEKLKKKSGRDSAPTFGLD